MFAVLDLVLKLMRFVSTTVGFIDVINGFIQCTFFTFLTFIFVPHFYFLKTLSKAKYEYAKIQQRETLVYDASVMIFLLILICYISHNVHDSFVWPFLSERSFYFIGGH